MALRSSWEGFLKLSLISVPVRAYNAAIAGGGDIHFHQIHKGCGSRVRYQKVCPIHGEVTKEDIVSGYEYDKDAYVEFEPGEISKLRAKDDESINIEAFIAPESLDPIYLSGKTFYLVPDGPAGQKPYSLLQRVMQEKNRYALAGIIISGHEETVVLRPADKLLTMTVLYHESEVKKPAAFEDEISESKISAQESKLAGTLVDASTTEKIDFSQYTDKYTERTRAIIEAKLAGQDMTAPQHEKTAAPVINLMEALKKSLQETGNGKHTSAHKRSPPRPRTQRSKSMTG